MDTRSKKQLKKEAIWAIVSIGMLFIGFVLGSTYTHYNYFELISHIQVDEITIDFNETELVNSIFEREDELRELVEMTVAEKAKYADVNWSDINLSETTLYKNRVVYVNYSEE